MIVTHIDGRSEYLSDYKSLQRKRRVNGEYSLSFLLLKTERNEHSFPLTVEESLIEYDGQEYRIKKMSEKTIGNMPVKQIQADHTFFDLVDEYQYETITGAKQLAVCIAHALEGTDYTFEVIDPFSSVEFENFGDDNALSLIQVCLNRFGAEIEINRKHLKFRRQIGRKTDIQFRYKYNIKTLEKHVDSSNLSTFIRGFGKQNVDGTYTIATDYTSPLATIYGIRHAKPVYDERYTTIEGLNERLRQELQDKPEVSIKLEAVELKKAGINTEQLELGDDIYTIYEPLDIDINARIVEILEFPEEPTSSQFTIANVRGSVIDSIVDFQRTKDRIDGIFEGKEKLPFNVLDDAVQRATLALKSAQSELEFENGIIARDSRDPNRLMIITSAGIGISTNGGKTFKEAITADGFVLSAGAIGQLSANNINVAGVVTAINDDNTLRLNAENINLDGKVTFSMFDSSTKNTINSKATSSDLSKAQADADAANAKLADIAADNKLTPDEKLEVRKEWKIIEAEYLTVISQAPSSVSTASYTNAYNALRTYITPLLTDMTATTTIARDTFDTRFRTYYSEKIKLLKAISDSKTDPTQVSNIINQTTIDGGKVTIVNNTDFINAKNSAEGAKQFVDLWKYGTTTEIDGGKIRTGTISAGKITVGPDTNFSAGYDPTQKETPSGAQAKAEEARKAAEAVAEAKSELARVEAESYADGIVTAEEQARISQAESNLRSAKSYADTQANIAKATADQAKKDADTANTKLSDIAADNKLTPNEKLEVKKEWLLIESEVFLIAEQAETYTMSVIDFAIAFLDLRAYITPLLADLIATTTIDRDVFNGNFKKYYDEKVTLLKNISDKSKQLVDSATKIATDANDTVNLWKYPGTTVIDGGNIYTNSITTNKLSAGTLTGFVIQTNANTFLPRVYMGGSKLEVSNAGGRVTIDAQGWNDYAGLIIESGTSRLNIQAYDGRVSMTGSPIEMWTTLSVMGSLDVQGSKNASVPTSIGRVNVSAYETAEYYFGDIGRGEVVDGECVVEIESLFKETVNTNIDYEVFLTPYGKGSIYVDEMTPSNFTVKGDDIHFAYEIKAKRKGYETVRLEATKESEVESVAY